MRGLRPPRCASCGRSSPRSSRRTPTPPTTPSTGADDGTGAEPASDRPRPAPADPPTASVRPGTRAARGYRDPVRFVELDLGTRHVDYRETWDLQRARAGRGRRRDPRGHRPAVRARVRLHRRQAHRVVGPPGRRHPRGRRRPRRQDHLARRRASSSGTRSSGCAEPVDVVAYVRALEDALIGVCAELGLTADRVEGRSGVWFPGDGGPPRPQGRAPSACGSRAA